MPTWVALLAHLGQLQYHIVALELGADGQGLEVVALHHQILTKSAVVHYGTSGPEGLHLLVGEQGNLTVPLASVGVPLNAPVLHELGGAHILLLGTLLFTDTDSDHFAHGRILQSNAIDHSLQGYRN